MKRLMEYLPEWYENSAETRVIQEALQPEIEMLWQIRNDLLAQLDPNTATWGITFWENAFGLPHEDKELEYRRSRVISKIRGTGTVTKKMVNEVSTSFANGEVEVVEIPGESRIEIHFVSSLGVPSNLEDLKNALMEIVPAHLAIQYCIYYRMHSELAPYTHQQLGAFTHQTIKEGAIG